MLTLNVKLEIKALSKREFEGHGSTFGNVDLGDDIVMRGAFRRSLAEHRKAGTLPQMFWMHRPDQVPGKWTEMEEDEKGLYVKGVLANTQLGNDMHELVQMKAVRGLSIGFRTMDQDFDDDGHRLLKEIDLWEVSLVSLAMNPLAKVEAAKAVRLSSDGEYVPTVREFERALRDVGCTQLTAKRMLSKIFDDTGIRDVDLTRDVDDVDQAEAAEVLKILNASTSTMLRGVFQR